MNDSITTIWKIANDIGLNCNESDAHDIYLALKKKGYISEKGLKSKSNNKSGALA